MIKKHEYIRRTQQKYFTECMTQAALGEIVVVQVDFAENYRTLEQDEIQSAHYSYKQVTVFTMCIWGITQDKPDMQKLIVFSDGAASQFKSKYAFFSMGCIAR